MENYIVSARKYRPTTFHSVVGQKSLTTTLKNAIHNNKLAHAYLFCGPRGVGKTTCARIFAKTINCQHPTEDGEACNACESCVSFNEGRSYSIHELDAASNNSVDDIRSLIEQVRIPPQLGRYKVYIIDEVHMLSTAAFNAFLKTLEEPPHHAVFVLATTEKHKILSTILSRCQIYDFGRISINDTVEHLQYVAQQENVSAEPEALNIIAQKADGGMRDALSIFDQVISFTGGNITYKAVIENLNVLDYEYYFRLTDILIDGKVSEGLLILNEILNKGFDGQYVLSGLASFFRDLLVCKDPQTLVLFEVGDSVKEKYKACAARCDNKLLYKAIELTNECDLNYRISRNKRLHTELLLIRLCQLNASGETSGEDKKKILIEPLSPQKVEQKQPDQAKAPDPVQQQTTVRQSPVPASHVSGDNTKGIKAAPRGALNISLKSQAGEKSEITDREVISKSEESIITPFSQEELEKAWVVYAENLKEELHLKNTMLNILPKLNDDYSIVVSVHNPQQEKKLQEEAVTLMNFLRKQLNNSAIRMNVNISEENTRQLAYTDIEKYKLMASQNTNLDKLAAEFGLKLD